MPRNLEGEASLTLSGTWEGEAGLRLALVSLALLADGAAAMPLYDQGLDATWTIGLNGPPGETHLLEVAELDVAIELPEVYEDVDGSNNASAGDVVVAGACHDGQLAGALWVPAPTERADALRMVGLGVTSGWSLIEEDATAEAGFRVVDALEAGNLELDEACAWTE